MINIKTEGIDGKGETLLVYTDGSSYEDKFSAWGFLALRNKEKEKKEEIKPENCEIIHCDVGILTGEVCSIRNIGGELKAVMEAVRWAKRNNFKIVICHDLQGASLWGEGIWKRNNKWTRSYHEFISQHKQYILGYTWVKGHANDYFNEKIDKIVGKAIKEYASGFKKRKK